jgi:hypothetical protein
MDCYIFNGVPQGVNFKTTFIFHSNKLPQFLLNNCRCDFLFLIKNKKTLSIVFSELLLGVDRPLKINLAF